MYYYYNIPYHNLPEQVLRNTQLEGHPESETIKTTQQQFNAARKSFRKAINEAAEYRDKFLDEQAERWAELKNLDKESRVKQLKHMEATRKTYNKIKFARNKMQNGQGLKSQGC